MLIIPKFPTAGRVAQGDRARGPPRAAELTVLRNQTRQQPPQRVVVIAHTVWQAWLPVLVRGLPEYGNCNGLQANANANANANAAATFGHVIAILLPHVLYSESADERDLNLQLCKARNQGRSELRQARGL